MDFASLNGLSMIALLGAVVILVGELVALKQRKNLIRLLVISSIAEIGYILLGLGLGTYEGTSGALLHLEYQIVMRALVFVAAAALIARERSDSIEKLKGIGKAMPVTATLVSNSPCGVESNALAPVSLVKYFGF
ncbi:proton-conducting transporter membrane subunit [Thermodesulfobacterium hveragerdense]|uniref:proton-conducting transporter transmembrane domain-containing protein n=1 Tax=Thermodesulfobacterium hveragerdense TaxID=53424 RepID=UPI00316ACCEC